MNGTDIDPNYSLPLWRALVDYTRLYPSLPHGHHRLAAPKAKLHARSSQSRPSHGWVLWLCAGVLLGAMLVATANGVQPHAPSYSLMHAGQMSV